MRRRDENPIAFRSLYDSPVVSVRDYCCFACRGGPASEEHSGSNNIVLLRRGAFSKHFGRRHVTADVNQVVFFSQGSTYRVSHPAECGDRGTIITPSPRVLSDIIREFDPSIDERPERAFPFVTGPCDSGIFWCHRELAQRLAAESASIEPLWVEEASLQLVATVVQAAFSRTCLPRTRRRKGTDADHADRAEAAKTYLASRLGQRITLDEVARAVHTSPFHLARVFQQQTGVPLHRYLTRLRLRTSLERLREGAADLTGLALELGFSSHSHFSDAFRREFASAPSALRDGAGRSAK
jgi:AraC family transcriptional regulator